MNADAEIMLAVERSTVQPSWTLWRAGAPVAGGVSDEEPARAPGWLARMTHEIAAAGVAPAAIARYVVGLGPGSFSGIRASLAGLQGMALPGRRPLLGLASAAAAAFATLRARAARGLRTPVAVVGDARRERLWRVIYALEDERLALFGGGRPTHTAADFSLVARAALSTALPAEAWVISPDADRLGALLAATLPAARFEARPARATAEDLAALFCADPDAARWEPLPIYLHPPVASAPRAAHGGADDKA